MANGNTTSVRNENYSLLLCTLVVSLCLTDLPFADYGSLGSKYVGAESFFISLPKIGNTDYSVRYSSTSFINSSILWHTTTLLSYDRKRSIISF